MSPGSDKNRRSGDWELASAQILALFEISHGDGLQHRPKDIPRQSCQDERDSLTGLPNFHCFRKRFALEAERSIAKGRPLSMAQIDIDGFGLFNENHGLPAGDICLKTVSVELQRRLPRRSDLVIRYHDDEFWVLMPDTNSDGAMQVAERLLRSASHVRIDLDNTYAGITVSIGLITIRSCEASHSMASLFNRTARALQLAKLGGRNRIVEAPSSVVLIDESCANTGAQA